MNPARSRIAAVLSVVGAVLAIFAASAHATTPTSNGSVYTSTIEASGKGKITVDGISCESSLKGEVTLHSPVLSVAAVKLSQINFSNCPEGKTITVGEPGELGIAALSPVLVSAMFLKTTFTITNHVSGSVCSYLATNSGPGQIYPSSVTGATAEIRVNSHELKYESGSPLCKQNITWAGTYSVHTPDQLNFDA